MFNSNFMVGHIASDPELKTVKGNVSLLKFNLAVDRPVRTAGAKATADYFPMEVWNKYAVALASQLKKGDKIVASARPVNRMVNSKNAVNGSMIRTYFTVMELVFWSPRAGIPAHMDPPPLQEDEFYPQVDYSQMDMGEMESAYGNPGIPEQ